MIALNLDLFRHRGPGVRLALQLSLLLVLLGAQLEAGQLKQKSSSGHHLVELELEFPYGTN